MAVSMKINTSDFVTKLYAGAAAAEGHKVLAEVLKLESEGWKLTFNMFMVTCSKEGKMAQDNFPCLIPHLMGGSLVEHELKLCRQVFAKIMNKVQEFKGAAPGLLEQFMQEAQMIAPKADPASIPAPISKTKKALQGVMPKGKPQSLADATVLNEIVLGTNEGNLYRTVALGPLKVAIRPSAAGVSVRVAGAFTPELVKRLAAMGFSKKPEYMSMHCQLGKDMPASRVVGAVLWSMEVPFTQMITNGKDIV